MSFICLPACCRQRRIIKLLPAMSKRRAHRSFHTTAKDSPHVFNNAAVPEVGISPERRYCNVDGHLPRQRTYSLPAVEPASHQVALPLPAALPNSDAPASGDGKGSHRGTGSLGGWPVVISHTDDCGIAGGRNLFDRNASEHLDQLTPLNLSPYIHRFSVRRIFIHVSP